MPLAQFLQARANRTLPAPTADQKNQIRTQLDALAASMGLPKSAAHKGPKKG
jgi:hypothetical protein